MIPKKYSSSGVYLEVYLPNNWIKKPYYKLVKPINLVGVSVPTGFITDAATIPRVFWTFFPPIGRYLKATIIHDYLLEQSENRRPADLKFLQGLEELGIVGWRKNLMFFMVRSYSIITTMSYN